MSAQTRDEEPEAMEIPAIRRPADMTARLNAELLRILFGLGDSSSITVFLGIVVVGLVFVPYYAPIWTLPAVIAVQGVAEMLFSRVKRGFREDAEAVAHTSKWAQRYTAVTALSGSTWGLAAWLWLPHAPLTHQFFFTFVLSVLCTATAVTRATYPPAVFVYTSFVASPTILLFVLRGDAISVAIFVLALLFFATLAGWTRHVQHSYREAVRLKLENADLLERMSRAHAAADQKRREAERAKAEAQAAAATKGAFLDMLGHEVRAPLSSMTRMAAQLGKTALDGSARGLAKSIETTSQLLSRLFDDMLDFSQMETQTLTLAPRQLDPSELSRDVVRAMRDAASKKGLSLELDLATDIPAAMTADPDRLRQVLINLIDNAIKFTDQGGVVLRAARVEGPEDTTLLRFSVTDTGPGLSEDMRQLVFDTFERGPQEKADNAMIHSAGLGLGLPICDRLVHLMGGQIGVDSVPGLGSTFWFLLPQEPGMAAEYLATLNSARSGEQQIWTAPLLDHGMLYEIENGMAGDALTEYLVEGLEKVLVFHRNVCGAKTTRNAEALRESAAELARAAENLGLAAIAENAHAIGEALDKGEEKAAFANVPRLERQITATWHALAQSYPSLGA
ncbi:sensor histidine kinase [Parvibaculum sp. MBR-TMA-1.3b-4.2]